MSDLCKWCDQLKSDHEPIHRLIIPPVRSENYSVIACGLSKKAFTKSCLYTTDKHLVSCKYCKKYTGTSPRDIISALLRKKETEEIIKIVKKIYGIEVHSRISFFGLPIDGSYRIQHKSSCWVSTNLYPDFYIKDAIEADNLIVQIKRSGEWKYHCNISFNSLQFLSRLEPWS